MKTKMAISNPSVYVSKKASPKTAAQWLADLDAYEERAIANARSTGTFPVVDVSGFLARCPADVKAEVMRLRRERSPEMVAARARKAYDLRAEAGKAEGLASFLEAACACGHGPGTHQDGTGVCQKSTCHCTGYHLDPKGASRASGQRDRANALRREADLLVAGS